MVRTAIQEFLEVEMAEAIGAQKGERVERRLSYRSGYYARSLITR
jgi:putative transposase